MAKYAVGYLIVFLFLAVILTGFLGFGVQSTGIVERPGVVVTVFPEPSFPDPAAFPPAPDTGR